MKPWDHFLLTSFCLADFQRPGIADFSCQTMKTFLALPLALGLLLGLAKPGRSEVLLNLEREFYSVNVARNAPLFPQLLRASPITQKSVRYTGYTSAPIKWDFKYRLDAITGQCRIVSSRTFLNAKITMPRIVGASDRQINAFNRFYAALLRHEMGHYAIAGETAFAIDYELTAMPPMQTCALLEQQANSKAYERLQESYTKVLTYDELSRHGSLQGAVLQE